MYYVEYYRRRPGVPLERFHHDTTSIFDDWAQREPEDELVANLGRTWRMGPHPYLLVWRCRGIERLDEWNATFSSGEADDVEQAVLSTLETYASGFYRELWAASRPLEDGFFYFESFVPWDDALESYQTRARESGASVALAGERVGLLAPDPGGIALLSIPSLSVCERLQRAPHPNVRQAGLLAPAGKEIL